MIPEDVEDWYEVVAAWKAAGSDPSTCPRLLRGIMLMMEKNVEDALRRKWKGRFVGLAPQMVDALRRIIKERLMHIVPASPALLRFTLGWSLLTETRAKRGDTPGAYLEADLSGPPTYLECDEETVPSLWRTAASRRMRRPVRRLWKSLYGTGRGDTDWGLKARKTLISPAIGARHIMDHGECSLYLYEPKDEERDVTLIVVYVDDILAFFHLNFIGRCLGNYGLRHNKISFFNNKLDKFLKTLMCF